MVNWKVFGVITLSLWLRSSLAGEYELSHLAELLSGQTASSANFTPEEIFHLRKVSFESSNLASDKKIIEIITDARALMIDRVHYNFMGTEQRVTYKLKEEELERRLELLQNYLCEYGVTPQMKIYLPNEMLSDGEKVE